MNIFDKKEIAERLVEQSYEGSTTVSSTKYVAVDGRGKAMIIKSPGMLDGEDAVGVSIFVVRYNSGKAVAEVHS